MDEFWLPGVPCAGRLGGRDWGPWGAVLPSVASVRCGLERKGVSVGVPGDPCGSAAQTSPQSMEPFCVKNGGAHLS